MAKVVTIKTFGMDGTTVNATGDPANFESWTDGDSAVSVTGLLSTLDAESDFQRYWKVSCDLGKFTNDDIAAEVDDPDHLGSHSFISGATALWGDGGSTKFSITCSDAPVPDPSSASSSSGLSDEEVAGIIIGSIAAAILLYVLYIKYFTSN